MQGLQHKLHLYLEADHADVAAAAMKLKAKGFTWASRGFGGVGIEMNVYEMTQECFNWEDAGQIALGGALFIPGLNGAVVIVGGTALFAWELYELLRD